MTESDDDFLREAKEALEAVDRPEPLDDDLPAGTIKIPLGDAAQFFRGMMGGPPEPEPVETSPAEQERRDRVAEQASRYMEMAPDQTPADAWARAWYSAEVSDLLDAPAAGSYALASLAWQGLARHAEEAQDENRMADPQDPDRLVRTLTAGLVAADAELDRLGYMRPHALNVAMKAAGEVESQPRVFMGDPEEDPEDGRDLLEKMGTDAERWVDEFLKRFAVARRHESFLSKPEEQEGLMFGWFANAIQAGAAEAHQPLMGRQDDTPRLPVLTREAARNRIAEVLTRPGPGSLYGPAAQRCAEQILEALAQPTTEPPLFGTEVGDGLDEERQHAADAMDLLRGLLASELLSLVEGMDHAFTAASAPFPLQPSQAALLRGLMNERREARGLEPLSEPFSSVAAVSLVRMLVAEGWLEVLDNGAGRTLVHGPSTSGITLAPIQADLLESFGAGPHPVEGWPEAKEGRG
jgi:hypothetical protein